MKKNQKINVRPNLNDKDSLHHPILLLNALIFCAFGFNGRNSDRSLKNEEISGLFRLSIGIPTVGTF